MSINEGVLLVNKRVFGFWSSWLFKWQRFQNKGEGTFSKDQAFIFDNATFLRSRWDFIDRNFVFRVHFLIKDHNPTFIDLTFYHFLELLFILDFAHSLLSVAHFLRSRFWFFSELFYHYHSALSFFLSRPPPKNLNLTPTSINP